MIYPCLAIQSGNTCPSSLLPTPILLRQGRLTLLGADIYSDVLLHGRRCGPPNTFETQFGRVLTGRTNAHSANHLTVAPHHTAVVSGDDLIIGKPKGAIKPLCNITLCCSTLPGDSSETGRFIIPLPKDTHSQPLGESRPQAVRRFLTLERSPLLQGSVSRVLRRC